MDSFVTHLERLCEAQSTPTASGHTLDPAPAIAAAELRLAIVTRRHIESDARRALRLVRRAERTATHLDAYRQLALTHADDADVRRDLQELRREHDLSNRLGRVTSWVAPALTGILGLSFVLNEVPFMYSTARIQFDVPLSVAPADLANPSNALAIGLSVIVPAVLFAAIGVGSRSLAWALYPTVRDETAPLSGRDLTPRSELWAHIPTYAYLGGALVTIVGLCVVLHQLAVLRFEGVLFGSSSTASGVYVALITLLPITMLLVATAAENPRFVHHRRLTLTRLWRALEFAWLTLREWRLARRYERHHFAAARRLLRMDDSVVLAAWRADLEYLDASCLTHALPVAASREGALTRSGDRCEAATATRFLPTVPDPSVTRTAARARFDRLPIPTGGLPLAQQWRRLAQDPHHFSTSPVDPVLTGPDRP